jgi:hypothetical protein
MYKPLEFNTVPDPRLQRVFERADTYLHDVYGMFRWLAPKNPDPGGGGNFSIVLVLLCVVDGLAGDVLPGRGEPAQNRRFKQLLRYKFHWGPVAKGWIDPVQGADQLYYEFRNPLVHELAADKVHSSRPAGFVEPVIGKWGVPKDWQDITKIEALASWDDDWPIIGTSQDDQGRPRIKVGAAGLYWAVKRLANNLIAEVR